MGHEGNLGPLWVRLLEFYGAIVVAVGLPKIDVADKESVLRFRDDCVEVYGVPSIIINNAAIDNPPGSLADFFGNYKRIMEVNAGGVVNMVEAFHQEMIDNGGGNIVNIGSMLGFVASDPRNYPAGFDKPCAYGMAKAAIWNFTNNCNVRFAHKKLISNVLALSAVEGSQSDEFKEKYQKKIPIRRMLTEEDFALEFLTACTARVPYDAPLFVGGGWTLW
jgi:NAD(P)-dependent dehydrogenase (short-subunit alcohol dehydrogenase family)